jgi:hypothetical protein
MADARRARTEGDGAAPPPTSVAVLPFLDLSAERDQDFLCDGIAEEILTALTHVEGLRVAARSTSFQFKAKGDVGARTAGTRLGVDAVLEGSIRKATAWCRPGRGAMASVARSAEVEPGGGDGRFLPILRSGSTRRPSGSGLYSSSPLSGHGRGRFTSHATPWRCRRPDTAQRPGAGTSSGDRPASACGATVERWAPSIPVC